MLVKENWGRVLGDLQQRVGDEAFNLWLRHVVKLKPELLEVGVANMMAGEWLDAKFSGEILSSVERIVGFRPRKVRFSVNGHLFRELRRQEAQARGTAPVVPVVKEDAKPRVAPAPVPRQIFNLNERYTLDRVIVGPNNQLAFNCAFEVARRPGTQSAVHLRALGHGQIAPVAGNRARVA